MDIQMLTNDLVESFEDRYKACSRPEEKIVLFGFIDSIIDELKAAKAQLQEDYIKLHRNMEVIINDKKYYVGEEKRNKFNTQLIYEYLKKQGGMDWLLRILPANPTFKKKELMKYMDEHKIRDDLFHEDVLDKIKIKAIPLDKLPDKGGDNE